MLQLSTKTKLLTFLVVACISLKFLLDVISFNTWGRAVVVINLYVPERDLNVTNASVLMPYHHVIDQFQWIAAFNPNGVWFHILLPFDQSEISQQFRPLGLFI